MTAPGRRSRLPGWLSSLTTRGRSLLAAGAACGVAAAVLGEEDLVRVGLLLAALPLLGCLAVRRTRYRLSAERAVTPPRVQVGDAATVTLRLANLSRLPTATLLLADHVPETLGQPARCVLDRVEAGAQREVAYRIRTQTRGRYPVGPLSVVLRDPFGTSELVRHFATVDDLVVLPAVEVLRAVRLPGDRGTGGDGGQRTTAGTGEDDLGTREYRSGDDLRKVHWRTSARRGQLMVRREEAPWRSRAALLLDLRRIAHQGTGPASSVEWAVSAAASISTHISRRGFGLRLVDTSGNDVGGPAGFSSGAGTEGPVLDTLAAVTLSAGGSLPRSAARLDAGGGILVAVVGGLREEDALALARLGAGTGAAIAVLLDVATWGSGERRSATEDVEVTARRLQVAGWSTLIARQGDQLAPLWDRMGVGGFGSRAADPSTDALRAGAR